MKLKKHLTTIIFYGAIWGILEATLGYLLHFLPIYISGTVMFPIVSYVLYRAYKKTNSLQALFSVGVLAAGIKAVNFFMPFGSPFKIINPMIFIILESLMVLTVIKAMDKEDLTSKASAFIVASIGWRALYLGYNGVQYITSGFVSDYLASFNAAFMFLIVYGFISAVLATCLHYVAKAIPIKEQKFTWATSPIISIALLVIAITVTLIV